MMLGTVGGIMEVVGSRLCLALMLFASFLIQIGVALATFGLVTSAPMGVQATPCAARAADMQLNARFACWAVMMLVVPHATALLARECHSCSRHAPC